MKRFNENTQIPNEEATSSHEESFRDRMQRMTEHELSNSHNALPVFVESLFLAAELGHSSLSRNTESILSIENILSLTQFSKKKKWLCTWGPEFIDETHRISNTHPPICIEQKGRKLSSAGSYVLCKDFFKLLSDPTQRWERIFLPEYHPDYLELLHLHPCEELRLTFDLDDHSALTREELEKIARCKTLRLLDMERCKARPDDIVALQKLPKLEKVISSRVQDAFGCLKSLAQLPQTNSIQINSGGFRCSSASPAYPFQDHALADALTSLLIANIRQKRSTCKLRSGQSFWLYLHNARK